MCGFLLCFHATVPTYHTRCDVTSHVLLQQQGKSNILVSTDVAARGLHINRLQYVVNYDFPLNLEQYCHRVGRTGRQGKEGQAYSLLSRNMSMLAADLIKLLEVCASKLV
jgi:superfamily II DNA/RNA helicase